MRLHRMSFLLFVNIILSEEDCQALLKESRNRNSCDGKESLFLRLLWATFIVMSVSAKSAISSL